ARPFAHEMGGQAADAGAEENDLHGATASQSVYTAKSVWPRMAQPSHAKTRGLSSTEPGSSGSWRAGTSAPPPDRSALQHRLDPGPRGIRGIDRSHPQGIDDILPPACGCPRLRCAALEEVRHFRRMLLPLRQLPEKGQETVSSRVGRVIRDSE